MTPSPSREPVDHPVRDFAWFWQGATAALLALCAVIGLYEFLFRPTTVFFEKQAWHRVTARVDASPQTSYCGVDASVRACWTYTYVVAGKHYRGSGKDWAPPYWSKWDRSDEPLTSVGTMPLGQHFSAYYDPEHPGQSVPRRQRLRVLVLKTAMPLLILAVLLLPTFALYRDAFRHPHDRHPRDADPDESLRG